MSSTRTLVALALGTLGASCSPISVEQRDVTVSRHVARVQNERAPEHDRIEVRSRLEGSIAVVEVAWIPACRVRDRETRVVRRKTIRRADTTVVVLEVVGCGVVGNALMLAAVRIDPHDDPYAPPEEREKPMFTMDPDIALVGLSMAGVAAAAAIIEAVKAKDSSQERTEMQVSPARVEPCAGMGAQDRMVSLIAAGTTLTGVVDQRGVARIPIDDATWKRFSGVFDADVRFEGVPVGRVRFVRTAP